MTGLTEELKFAKRNYVTKTFWFFLYYANYRSEKKNSKLSKTFSNDNPFSNACDHNKKGHHITYISAIKKNTKASR